MKTFLLAPIVAGVLAAPLPAHATVRECSNYRYATSSATLCSDFGNPDDADCADLGNHPIVVTGTDPWQLDRDHDGTGCDGEGSTPFTPKPSPSRTSASASPRPSRTTHKPSPTTSTPATSAGPQLPKTGPAAPTIIGIGVLALAAGGGIVVASRRRKARFQA